MANYRDLIVSTALAEDGKYLYSDIEKYWKLLGFQSRVEYCACFVNWVYHQYGLTTLKGGANLVLASGRVVDIMNWYKNRNRYMPPSYNPQPGDLIVFKWKGASVVGHIGIVTSYDSNYIYTIEGNTKSPSGRDASVSVKKRSRSTGEIHGFCAVELPSSQSTGVKQRPNLKWITSNKQLSLKEMENNALLVNDYLRKKGWTINAIAGLLGNMEKESTINPGRWQSGLINNLSGGYGLVQWTPATNLTVYLNKLGLPISSGDAQLGRLIWELENNKEWIKRYGSMSFREYTKSTKPAGELTKVFTLNYERPKDAEMRAIERMPYGEKWYKFLASNVGDGSIVQVGTNQLDPASGQSNNYQTGGVYYKFAKIPSSDETLNRATINLSWLTNGLFGVNKNNEGD